MSLRADIRTFLATPIPGDFDGLQAHSDRALELHEAAWHELREAGDGPEGDELADAILELRDRVTACYQGQGPLAQA
jgi:hypothetical protein